MTTQYVVQAFGMWQDLTCLNRSFRRVNVVSARGAHRLQEQRISHITLPLLTSTPDHILKSLPTTSLTSKSRTPKQNLNTTITLLSDLLQVLESRRARMSRKDRRSRSLKNPSILIRIQRYSVYLIGCIEVLGLML
jgi:hypothetical protein